jgi:hypothetical protein
MCVSSGPTRCGASSLEDEDRSGSRLARQRPAEEGRQLATEHQLQACSSAPALGGNHALQHGAMLEESRGSMIVPFAAEACGGHVKVIDRPGPAHDPWREGTRRGAPRRPSFVPQAIRRLAEVAVADRRPLAGGSRRDGALLHRSRGHLPFGIVVNVLVGDDLALTVDDLAPPRPGRVE